MDIQQIKSKLEEERRKQKYLVKQIKTQEHELKDMKKEQERVKDMLTAELLQLQQENNDMEQSLLEIEQENLHYNIKYKN